MTLKKPKFGALPTINMPRLTMFKLTRFAFEVRQKFEAVSRE